VQRFNVHLKLARGQLSLAHGTTVKTDIPEKIKKTAEIGEVRLKVEAEYLDMEKRICGKVEF